MQSIQHPPPYMGYWSKLRYGKPVMKIMLPTNFEGKDEIIISKSTEVIVTNQKEISSRTSLIEEIETKHKHLLEVPLRLVNPDALIVKAKDALTTDKNYWSDKGLIGTRSGVIKIGVAPDNVP